MFNSSSLKKSVSDDYFLKNNSTESTDSEIDSIESLSSLSSDLSYESDADDTDCSCTFSYDNISNSSRYDSMGIPKIIMQTWKTKDIPEKWAISPKSIKKYMPDWKYVLMTDKDNRRFIKKHFPDFLETYDGFEYNIQKADSIRYAWLYIHGGIYMDLDFEMQHSLDEFFKSDSEVYLVSSGNIGSYITNSFMASKPRCNLWLEMIEAMKKPGLSWYHMGKHMKVMLITGPIMLTHVIKKSKTVYSMLPGRLFMPCSTCKILTCDSSGSYLKPLEGSSWISYDTKVYNFFMCQWKKLLILLGVIILLFFIFLLLHWWCK
uniref:Glycosyltransferase n=1 Tax=Pithovirus LCPAC302 TaxID=2506593 RepID=A0A481Z851_9VIRU|nr:MAG: glycosyltransferase [Pithovirus LCPAC302]